MSSRIRLCVDYSKEAASSLLAELIKLKLRADFSSTRERIEDKIQELQWAMARAFD